MIIFIRIGLDSQKYIAGTFSTLNSAIEYLRKFPPTRLDHDGVPEDAAIILNLDLVYPFYVLEQDGEEELEDFEFYQSDNTPAYLEAKNVCSIYYKIEKDFVPEVPWEDQMGILEHAHREDDLEE